MASLDVVGTAPSDIKRYLLTDEYAGNWTIANIPSTTSELNGAAVSGALRIDLSRQTSSNVFGKALTLGAGIDRLLGGSGNDTLLGGTGNETILGGRGNDSIDGGAGHDQLIGGSGNDILMGGAGQDLLECGDGNDSLWGGADADVFLIDGDAASTTTIKDFTVGVGGDTVQIRTQTKLDWSSVAQTVVGSTSNSPSLSRADSSGRLCWKV